MGVPVEIRLAIYDYLFDDRGHDVFELRNQEPEIYKKRNIHRRTQYRVLSKNLVRQSTPTTYHLLTDVELHPAIMAVNGQIYEEIAPILYGNRRFSFDRDVEAVVPFFNDLNPSTRPLVKKLGLTKHGAVYGREFDRFVWASTCRFLREEMQLKSLRLVVQGGQPLHGWEGLPEFHAEEFKTLQRVGYEHLEWVWELLTVTGLQDLQVLSDLHHCPPSRSSGMEFYVAFSASIETGFTDFLLGQMIEGISEKNS